MFLRNPMRWRHAIALMKKISDEARAYLNDNNLIADRDMWFSRMTALFEGRDDPYNDRKVYTLHGIVPRPRDNSYLYTDPEGWIVDCLELMLTIKGTQPGGFTPVCVEYPPYGVHYIDKMFGANVYHYAGQWNVDYLKTPIGELEMPDLEKDETWQISKRAVYAFLDADVRLPLFGLPTLSSPLNILLNLYGQDALLAMYEDEDAVRHDLDVINTLIRTLHRWYIDNIPKQQLQPVISWARTQPPGFGQLCGCTTQLISADMYLEFIAKLDNDILGEYEHGGMIHLCGSHTQHLKTFHDMKNLRSVQLNDRAAEDLALYLEGLRKDQIIYVNPCKTMPVEKIMEISKGEQIVLVANAPSPDKIKITS